MLTRPDTHLKKTLSHPFISVLLFHSSFCKSRACINTPKPSVYFYSLALGGDDTELFLSDV